MDMSYASSKEKSYAERRLVVEKELNRVSRLPANSSYVAHRVRVLNKALHLLSLQRTSSEEQELESLFAGLQLL